MNTKIPEFNSRAAFEAWFADGNFRSIEKDEAGRYKSIQTANAWVAWQCAIVSAAGFSGGIAANAASEVSDGLRDISKLMPCFAMSVSEKIAYMNGYHEAASLVASELRRDYE
jgi:hypothetical protein